MLLRQFEYQNLLSQFSEPTYAEVQAEIKATLQTEERPLETVKRSKEPEKLFCRTFADVSYHTWNVYVRKMR